MSPAAMNTGSVLTPESCAPASDGGVYVNVRGAETPTTPFESQLLTTRVCLPGVTRTHVLVEKFCAPPVV